MGFFQPIFPRMRTEFEIVSLYAKIRVRENPFSDILYVVKDFQEPHINLG